MSILLVIKCDRCKELSPPMYQEQVVFSSFQVVVPGGQKALNFCSEKCISEFFSEGGGPGKKPEKNKMGFDTTVAVSRVGGFADDPDAISTGNVPFQPIVVPDDQ